MLTRIRKSELDREGGFTLIELLVVIIIIGILASVAIPVFLNQRTKGYDTAAKSDLRNLATNQETLLTDTNSYGTIAQIQANNGTDSVKVSKQVTVTVAKYDLANGYCLVGNHASSKNFWLYDSTKGGLANTKYADAAAAAGACGITGGVVGDSKTGS